MPPWTISPLRSRRSEFLRVWGGVSITIFGEKWSKTTSTCRTLVPALQNLASTELKGVLSSTVRRVELEARRTRCTRDVDRACTIVWSGSGCVGDKTADIGAPISKRRETAPAPKMLPTFGDAECAHMALKRLTTPSKDTPTHRCRTWRACRRAWTRSRRRQLRRP